MSYSESQNGWEDIRRAAKNIEFNQTEYDIKLKLNAFFKKLYEEHYWAFLVQRHSDR